MAAVELDGLGDAGVVVEGRLADGAEVGVRGVKVEVGRREGEEEVEVGGGGCEVGNCGWRDRHFLLVVFMIHAVGGF